LAPPDMELYVMKAKENISGLKRRA
jgi:hypothetical protein